MQLGTSGGGVTIRAANAAGTSRTITLSGILSGNGGLVKTGPGTLALGGANTFDGGITLRNGTINAITNDASLGAGTVTMGGAGSTGASLLTGRTLANPITVNAPDSGSVVIGANGGGSGYTLSGGITLNGDLTIRTFDNIINGSIKAQGTLTGGITGSGNVILDNLGLAANALIFNTGAINHTGSLTLQGSATGDTTINADIGSNVTSVTQNSATSRMVLTGTNTYSGATLVSAGTLLVSGSLISDVTVSDGATLAGGGTVGAITFGGLSFFDMFSPVNSADSLAATTISFGATGFGIGSLRFNGSAVAWSLIDDGTYTLITGTLNSSNLGNFGVANAFDLGDDRIAYFQDGSLQLVVETIPEPRAALLGGLGLFCLLRRRRY
jgi:autotransporter-associated beta strand protein